MKTSIAFIFAVGMAASVAAGTLTNKSPANTDSVLSQNMGGRKLTTVSTAYSIAFLLATLPQITAFAQRLNLPIDLPVRQNQITNVEIGLLDGDTLVQIILNNGHRFNYHKGYVSGYYADDSYYASGTFGRPALNKAELYWPHPVSRDEMIRLAREAVVKLGYSAKTLDIEGKPDHVSIPQDTKTNHFTRYEVGWHLKPVSGFKIFVEIDAKTKTVKTMQLDDTNLWRQPPKINVPAFP